MSSKRTGLGGGIFLIIGMAAGVLIGARMGQPSAGIVIGLAIGSALALILWAIDRRRA